MTMLDENGKRIVFKAEDTEPKKKTKKTKPKKLNTIKE